MEPEAATIELRGKRALVTGAGTRVGAAIARALGAEGMRVAVHYHGSHVGAERTCDAIVSSGGEAVPFSANLCDEAAARGLMREVIARFGGLDLLVPSAANFDAAPFQSITHATWERALSLNLLSPFALAQEAAAALTESRGAIVLITDAARLTPYRGRLPYQVSKAALHQMMRLLALELAPHVRVNAVAPGTVLPPEELSEQVTAELMARIPLHRFGSAQSVVDAVLHLARSSFITGTELVVDGGRSVA